MKLAVYIQFMCAGSEYQIRNVSSGQDFSQFQKENISILQKSHSYYFYTTYEKQLLFRIMSIDIVNHM